jgi:uncharacterized membrane protein YkvA (DUF1232 family)
MAEEEQSKAIRDNNGFFSDVGQRIKLIWRLIIDPRVNIFLKLIPVASFIYLIIPAPIPPDLIPTPIDDAMILWLGTYLFVELCPQDVVEEHKKALQLEIPGNWRDPSAADEEIVDAEWKDA